MDILSGITLNCTLYTFNKYEKHLNQNLRITHRLQGDIKDSMYIKKGIFTNVHQNRMIRYAKHHTKHEAVSKFLQTMSKYFTMIEYDNIEGVFKVL